ncbi:MAG: ABC transporter ATP-binding protein [Nitrosomonas sp.]|nr:ABC transporter ATP-binding protein [Nitrosomonas sp.]
MLAARQLSLQYPGKRLCRSLNFEVNPGECWAILGQNGCGKTTLLHALGGLRAPDSGTVTIQGNAISALPRRERACKLGVMLQEEPGEFWGTVRDYILLGRYPHVKSLFGWDDPDYAMVEKVIAKLDLSQLADRSLSTLSGGERQRARIALLLAQSPEYYLLDEPLQHLDLRHQYLTMALLHDITQQGQAVIMVLHDIHWLTPFCDHVLMLFNDGHALAGKTTELVTQANLEALYQCRISYSSMNERTI